MAVECKVPIATQIISMMHDLETPSQPERQSSFDASHAKDRLNTGLTGQIRYKADERNPYVAYLCRAESSCTSWAFIVLR